LVYTDIVQVVDQESGYIARLAPDARSHDARFGLELDKVGCLGTLAGLHHGHLEAYPVACEIPTRRVDVGRARLAANNSSVALETQITGGVPTFRVD
jgi:hypothetical protein